MAALSRLPSGERRAESGDTRKKESWLQTFSATVLWCWKGRRHIQTDTYRYTEDEPVSGVVPADYSAGIENWYPTILQFMHIFYII